MNVWDYHQEAKDVIDTICHKIIRDHGFERDSTYYFPTRHRVVIFKNTLDVRFFWDFKDAQLFWSFRKRNEHRGVSYEYVIPEFPNLERVKILSQYSGKYPPSKNDDRFYPQSLKLEFSKYLELWYKHYPALFETGNYQLIEHLEEARTIANERWREEQKMIKDYLKSTQA